MTRKRTTNIIIVSALGLCWAMFVGLVVWGLLNDDQRRHEFAAIGLERMIGTQRARIRAALDRTERSLLTEADLLGRSDSVNRSQMLDRWVPLMENEWSISCIRLADERGGEISLERRDSSWIFLSTTSPNDLPLIMEWPLHGRRSHARSRIGEPVRDPRRSEWFGLALGSSAGDPEWSSDEEGSGVLDVSRQVTSNPTGKHSDVLLFEVNVGRALLTLSSPTSQYQGIMLGPDGRPVMMDASDKEDEDISNAVTTWQTDRTHTPFSYSSNDEEHIGQITELDLGHTRLFTGASVTLESLAHWTESERKAMWVALFLLILLGGLMTWILLRSRRTDRLVERTEKRSLSQEKRLARAINEREVLDREVHHRVKNNLQVISSMLNLQADRIADRRAKLEYMRSKRRIDSMALVHHKLYAQTDLQNVDMGIFFNQVANSMKAMFEPGSRTVSHTVDAQDVKLNADTTIQVGMILCELLSNCYQHAFPYVTGGHIDIVLRANEPGQFHLMVSDNGQGLQRDPAKADMELGLELVEAMVDQIDGRLEITAQTGTQVNIHFGMLGDGSVRRI